MEKDRRDPLPESDPDYIDQLLSEGNPAAKKEPQQPAVPTESTQAASTPKKPSTRLILLTAVICLLVAILLGSLTILKPQPDSGSTTSSTAPTLTKPKPEVDYTVMSTQQLVDIAIQIPELRPYGGLTSSNRLTPESYEMLKAKNPVLAELEQRPDAVELLTIAATGAPNSDASQAANALIRYYVVYLGFDNMGVTTVTPACQWYHIEDRYSRIFEYTEAPLVTQTSSSDGQNTIFDFMGALFMLEEWPMHDPENDANFWYRIEFLSENPEDQVASMPDPKLTWSSRGEGSWVTWQRYAQGWFVYGYTTDKTDLTFIIQTLTGQNVILLSFSPVPESGAASQSFAQCIFEQATPLYYLSCGNPDKDLATYPIVAALLEQPGSISALLNLAQGTNGAPILSIYPAFNYSALISVLSTSAFTDKMTTAESHALQLLRGNNNVYLDLYNPLHPTVLETPEGLALADMPDLRVGRKPESLKNIPPSEMNYWAFVPLTEGSAILQQPNWSLDVSISAGTFGPVGAWPVYDSGNALVGWLVSGKLASKCTLRLRLLQGDRPLYSSPLDAQPLDT